MVNFKDAVFIHKISKEKEYNYVEGRRRREKLNRRLNKIERYMRIHHLLFKGEYLNFGMNKSIRIPYIEKLAYNRGWIESGEHLMISF